MNENKDTEKEIIARKTLDFFFKFRDEADLETILYVIKDYEKAGYDLRKYRKRIKQLKKNKNGNNYR